MRYVSHMMNTSMLSGYPAFLAGLICAVMLSGCVTYGNARQRQAMHEREDMLLLEENHRHLKGRLEGLEMETEQLQRELAQQRTEQSRKVDQQLQGMESRLAGLERRIAEVDRAREADKQEIVDRLSKTIEQIIASRPDTTRGPRAAGGYGYEHTVQPGETLSQIAAAYGVRARAIIDANEIQNPDMLRVGQVLFIPE